MIIMALNAEDYNPALKYGAVLNTTDDISLAEGNIIVGDSNSNGSAVDASTSGQILVGDGTTVASVAVSGDATLSSAGALTLATPAKTKVAAINIGGIANSGQNDHVFVAPSACTITNLTIVSDTATTGSNGSNNYTFQIANRTQTNNLLSAVVSTNGNEIAADTAFDVTPDQNATLAANDVLELVITENGTATDLTSAKVTAFVEYTA